MRLVVWGDQSLPLRHPHPTGIPMNPSRLSARVSLLEGRLGALCLLSHPPPGEIWSVGGHWDVRGSEGLESVLEPNS